MAKKRKGRWTIARRVVQIVVAILFFVPLFVAGWSALGLGFSSPEEPLATPSGFAWWGSLSSSHLFGLDLLDPFAALQVAAAAKSVAFAGLAWALPVLVAYGMARFLRLGVSGEPAVRVCRLASRQIGHCGARARGPAQGEGRNRGGGACSFRSMQRARVRIGESHKRREQGRAVRLVCRGLHAGGNRVCGAILGAPRVVPRVVPPWRHV